MEVENLRAQLIDAEQAVQAARAAASAAETRAAQSAAEARKAIADAHVLSRAPLLARLFWLLPIVDVVVAGF
jgi:hypothetical protein